MPDQAPDSIAILGLYTDWYASTKHELETMYPRLVPGGDTFSARSSVSVARSAECDATMSPSRTVLRSIARRRHG